MQEYNAIYKAGGYDGIYHRHYRDTPYYPMWQRAALYLNKDSRILDLGCGPGQFAHMLFDMGVKHYRGIDFSSEAIRLARKTGGDFACEDILTCDWGDYDVVVCLETLEHIENDLGVIKRIGKGRRVVFSVPDYDSPTHVRTFRDMAAVKRRYGKMVNITRSSEFEIENNKIAKKGHIFICAGTKII